MTSPFAEMTRAAGAGQMEEKYRDLVAAVQGVWGTDASIAPSLPRGLRYQYWKKCDKDRCRTHFSRSRGYNLEKGWVTIGCTLESAPVEHAENINSKHMTPLPMYGWTGTGEGSELLSRTAGSRWNMILSKGGLIEFPRDQIIAYGWDKEPIVRQFRPDVLGVNRVECPYGCNGRDWPVDEDGHEEAFKTHVKAVHPTVEGPRETAKALSGAMEEFSKDFVAEMASRSTIDPAAIAAVVAATIAALEAAKAGAPAAEVPAPAAPIVATKRRGRPPGVPVIPKRPESRVPESLRPVGEIKHDVSPDEDFVVS